MQKYLKHQPHSYTPKPASTPHPTMGYTAGIAEFLFSCIHRQAYYVTFRCATDPVSKSSVPSSWSDVIYLVCCTQKWLNILCICHPVATLLKQWNISNFNSPNRLCWINCSCSFTYGFVIFILVWNSCSPYAASDVSCIFISQVLAVVFRSSQVISLVLVVTIQVHSCQVVTFIV